eukprot:PITA_29539
MASTSTGMGMFNTQLPQFNGKNYDYWAITMKALFASQDLWEIVEDGFDEPADETEFNRLTQGERDLLKSNRKKDSKARVFLYQAVDQSMFPRIAGAKTSKQGWQNLKTAYQGMEKVKTTKLQLLRRDFENLNMKESDNIDSFFTHVIALSTAEAEYVAATAAACQAVWMRWMLRSLGQEQEKATVIFCDNSSAIALSKNSVFHKRMKHIDTRFHYIRESVNNGEIVLEHCRTQEQVADILTKPLDQKSFEFLRKCLGMTECPAVEIKGEC